MNTENNRLIAEFMGYKIQKDPTERFFGRYRTAITKVWVKENELCFHSDWNWLMEVVEKIFKDFYKLNPCPIGLKMEIEKQLIAVDKEKVYKSCVEFIKWYNENK